MPNKINFFTVGEPRIWYCPSESKTVKQSPSSSFTINFAKGITGWQVPDHKCANQRGLDYTFVDRVCIKDETVRKAEEWEITDEAHKDTEFKYLFTLNILPLKIVPGHKSFPQAIDYSNMLDGNKGPKCEMSLRLVKFI